MKLDREKLKEILNKYFNICDSDFYTLMRSKEGFSYGTITIDDFVEFDEFLIEDLVEYIIEKYKEWD